MSASDHPDRYCQYMRSPHWTAVRDEYFRRRERTCGACGSRVGVELHHKTYERLEAEVEADLAPLCIPCHGRIHTIHRLSQCDLAEATDLYIADRRGRPAEPTRRDVGRSIMELHLDRFARSRRRNIVFLFQGLGWAVSQSPSGYILWSTRTPRPKNIWSYPTSERAIAMAEVLDGISARDSE